MAPVTHLFASWIVAAMTTDNPRDCRLVTLAGVVPDADSFGLVLDLVSGSLGWGQAVQYQTGCVAESVNLGRIVRRMPRVRGETRALDRGRLQPARRRGRG